MKDGQTMPLASWTACETPGGSALEGHYTLLEPLDWAHHRDGLYDAVGGAENTDLWDYMALGPFTDGPAAFERAFSAACEGWRVMVIRKRESGDVLGMASYMRLREVFGSAEVGCVAFGKALQRTRIGTEAIYLMAAHVFDDLGYRRFEWKCDTTNAASMRAAQRFDFVYEGVFRQDMVVKGRNRDSAWFSLTDGDWPDVKAAFRLWLQPQNFDAEGQQIVRLEALRAAL
jgi:RimJ/RimL family protein N-acetyltransferase